MVSEPSALGLWRLAKPTPTMEGRSDVFQKILEMISNINASYDRMERSYERIYGSVRQLKYRARNSASPSPQIYDATMPEMQIDMKFSSDTTFLKAAVKEPDLSTFQELLEDEDHEDSRSTKIEEMELSQNIYANLHTFAETKLLENPTLGASNITISSMASIDRYFCNPLVEKVHSKCLQVTLTRENFDEVMGHDTSFLPISWDNLMCESMIDVPKGLYCFCKDQGTLHKFPFDPGAIVCSVNYGEPLPDLYDKGYKLDYAHKLFDNIVHLTVVSWNMVIANYLEATWYDDGWSVFYRIHVADISTISFSYCSLKKFYNMFPDLCNLHSATLAVGKVILAHCLQIRVAGVVPTLEKAWFYHRKDGESVISHLIECILLAYLRLTNKIKHKLCAMGSNNINVITSRYPAQVTDPNVAARQGSVLASGVLPFTCFAKEGKDILRKLCACEFEDCLEEKDAKARVNAIKGHVSVCESFIETEDNIVDVGSWLTKATTTDLEMSKDNLSSENSSFLVHPSEGKMLLDLFRQVECCQYREDIVSSIACANHIEVGINGRENQATVVFDLNYIMLDASLFFFKVKGLLSADIEIKKVECWVKASCKLTVAIREQLLMQITILIALGVLSFTIFAMEGKVVLEKFCVSCGSEESLDGRNAKSQVNATKALAAVREPLIDAEECISLSKALHSIDSRDDVGPWVSESAIYGLKVHRDKLEKENLNVQRQLFVDQRLFSLIRQVEYCPYRECIVSGHLRYFKYYVRIFNCFTSPIPYFHT